MSEILPKFLFDVLDRTLVSPFRKVPGLTVKGFAELVQSFMTAHRIGCL